MAAFLVSVGRITEQAGSFRLRKGQGSGMIRLVWKSSPPNGGELRSGKVQSVRGIGQGRRIARHVRPGLKVHGLGRADADQNSQYFYAGGPLRHRGVEAVAALFDGGHVEPCGVGNGLDVVVGSQVVISSGDRRKLPFSQVGDCLRKHKIGIKVRVVGAAAVAGLPTGVEGQLHEIGKPGPSARSSGCATRQSPKTLKLYRLGALRYEVRVQEILMRKLIVGIVVNVLGKIVVDGFKLFGVHMISASAWYLVVLDACEFVVLHPKISLEYFRGCRKPEQGCISLGEPALVIVPLLLSGDG